MQHSVNPSLLLVERAGQIRQGRAGHHLVVPSGGHKEHDFALAEDWRDDSDVRQMTSSSKLRVVAHKHIAFTQPLLFARALCVVSQLQSKANSLSRG